MGKHMKQTSPLREVMKLHVSNKNMIAEITLKDLTYLDILDDQTWTKSDVVQFLTEKQITYGIMDENIDNLLTLGSKNTFPLPIAQGTEMQEGENGKIKYFYDQNTEVDRSKGWDFREVMRIPAVKEGDCLAKLIPPTKGMNGRTVYGEEIIAKEGTPFQISAGEYVVFDQSDACFYATSEGQVKIIDDFLHVYKVYEVMGDISYKTGNINFMGNVVIKGDIPSGFEIKATGDIKVFGLVEEASLEAGGSIYVSEGIFGKGEGRITAKDSIYAGFVNQGNLLSQNGIYIEKSILHSDCEAKNEIICENGNIIGGKISSGYKIEAAIIGNHLHTPTVISFGMGSTNYYVFQALEKEKSILEENIKKMDALYISLQKQSSKDKKAILTLARLKNSYKQTNKKLEQVNNKLLSSQQSLQKLNNAYLSVKDTIYANTIVTFGKYKQTMTRNYGAVLIRIEQNDMMITPLSS